MKLLSTVLFLIGFPFLLGAQTKGTTVTLKGQVVDEASRSPLEYATVSVFDLADSSLINGGVTDPTGVFQLEVPAGRYYARIEFLAYQSRTVEQVELAAGQPVRDLGVITLRSESTVLEEVVVKAEAGQVQMTLDKKIYNVSQDPASAGATAAEVLANLPSVSVDPDGSVSLRGSGSVRILIDGKPSGLLSFSGAEGLRQLQGNLIERIEIITNPSARYEAEGMSGIINIVLKKDTRPGVNGSFDFTVGYPQNYGAAINLNYRSGKLNLFTNYGISYRESPGRNTLYQEVYSGDTTYITRQSTDRTQEAVSNNIQLGADYFFNPQNSLTTTFTYRHSKGIRTADLEYYDYLFSTDNLTDITTRRQDETEIEPNLEYSLFYKKTFAREGQELTATVNYQDNSEDSQQDFLEHTYDADYQPSGEPDLQQRSDNYETEKQLLLQADYVHPFAKEGRLEAGLRSNLRDITNDYKVEELQDDLWQPLPGLDNNFLYDENIHAAYVMAGNKVKRFSYQLGLRAEYSDVTTELVETGEVNPRTYLNLFPSAHFTYEFNGGNSLQLSYSRRLRRPRFWDLSPFMTFTDNRNFFSGNPDLDPEFTHSFELGHIKYFEQATLSSAVYYRHTTGEIERIRTVDENGNSLTRPENLSTEDAFGFEFNATYTPYDWWKLDGNLNFFHSVTDGGNLGESFYASTYSWFTRLTSRFTILKKTDAQLRFFYRGPQETTQGRQKSMYSLDLAFSRDVLRDRGTLVLNITDLFNSRRRRSIEQGDNFYSESDFQWRPRQINLTLNYRLNQQKKQGERRGGNEEGEEGMQF